MIHNDIESPTTNLKETWGTWFFTPKLMTTSTSITEIYWNLKPETKNIVSYPNNFISYPRVSNDIKSLATILKETCGTWFFTPKLMRAASSITEIYWNLKPEPNNVVSDTNNIPSYSNSFT